MWELIEYFDVWGNEEDGYEVNAECIHARNLEVTDGMSDQDLMQILIDAGLCNEYVFTDAEVQDLGERIEFIDKDTGEPLCALVKQD